MRTNSFLHVAILYLMMDLSFEVTERGLSNGMSLEGCFVASLLPRRQESGQCQCAQIQHKPSSVVEQQSQVAIASETELDLVSSPGPFMRVMLVDDDFHTLDYAVETIESVMRDSGLGNSGTVRKERVQWTAFQAHFYGMGTVAVLPEAAAWNAADRLRSAGLGSKVVRD